MKKILALTFMVLFVATNCFAKTFSKPEKIGNIFGTPSGGFIFTGESQNNGSLYKLKNGKIYYWKELDTKTKKWYDVNVYEKGIAQFGIGNDALYVYYDFKKYTTDYGKGFGGNFQEGAQQGVKFGGKNQNNLFSLHHQIFESNCRIEKINSDKNLTLYMLIYNGSVGGYNYVLLGRQQNGTWIKYFDTEDINTKYFGIQKSDYGITMRMRGVNYKNYYCNGDTIVIEYDNYNNSTRRMYKAGEFRFKWDDAAQWFGVEHIIY